MTEEWPGEGFPLIRSEARWPILAAVVTVMVLTALRPADLRFAPRWVLPAVELVLLVALSVSHPAQDSKRSARLRVVALCIVAVVSADTLFATARLVDVLIHGGHATNSAELLLTAAATVWASNVIAFGLLYWLLDGGGAAKRARRPSRELDLAFPQHLNPEIAAAGWRPRFIDYLYLGLTASTAFSPTDVMPLAPWAKCAMGVQSMIAITVLGLVVARAVNVFA
jgi:hypothetical protein